MAAPENYDDESAQDLNFPSEFSRAVFLSSSHAANILSKRKKELDTGLKTMENDELFTKFHEYCTKSRKFEDSELNAVQRFLIDKRLEGYETAALCELVPNDIVKCKELIPSLMRFGNEEETQHDEDLADTSLEEIIHFLQSHKSA